MQTQARGGMEETQKYRPIPRCWCRSTRMLYREAADLSSRVQDSFLNPGSQHAVTSAFCHEGWHCKGHSTHPRLSKGALGASVPTYSPALGLQKSLEVCQDVTVATQKGTKPAERPGSAAHVVPWFPPR